MIFGKRKGAVKMPSDPRGAPLKRWCMEVMTTLQQLRDSGVDVPTGKNRKEEKHHFQASITSVAGGNYACSIRGGWCLNRVVSSGTDAVVRSLPQISIAAVLTDLPPDETAEIILTAGQYIFLNVTTDPNDVFDAAPTIVAAASSTTSTQAQPPDDTSGSGTDGDYYYPLAYLDSGVLKQIQQGGPITHDPILWEGENIGTGAKVFKDRDTANNRQRFRTIIGMDGITATQNAGDITLTLADIEDLNLTVESLEWTQDTADKGGVSNAVDVMSFIRYNTDVIHYWRNGLYIGTTDPSDGLGINQTVTYMNETS